MFGTYMLAVVRNPPVARKLQVASEEAKFTALLSVAPTRCLFKLNFRNS
jgi:hypothetical protein